MITQSYDINTLKTLLRETLREKEASYILLKKFSAAIHRYRIC